MTHATQWEREYDLKTLECTAARIAVALEPSPRTWLASGPNARWNPNGHALSDPNPPETVIDPDVVSLSDSPV